MIAAPIYAEAQAPRYGSTLVGFAALSTNPFAADDAFTSGPASGFFSTAPIASFSSSSAPFAGCDPLCRIEQEIHNLEQDEDEESPPTPYASAMAILLVRLSIALLGHRWISPRIATDGYGGLRLSWRRGVKELRAVITASNKEERYLYWEDQGSYGSVGNFTAATLFAKLRTFAEEDTQRAA